MEPVTTAPAQTPDLVTEPSEPEPILSPAMDDEEAGTTPPSAEDTTPAPEDETTPAPENETTPVPEDETTPVPEEETTPVPEEETTPAPEEETTPAPEEETTPAPEEETTSALDEEATPVPEEETTSALDEEATPVPEEETTSALDEEAISASEADATDSEPDTAAVDPTETAPIRAYRTRSDTRRIDRDLDWSQCGPLNDPATTAPQQENGETTINADAAELLHDEEMAIFSGNVEAGWGNQLLEADEVRYNKKNRVIDAHGSIYYQRPGLLLGGQSVHLETAENRGRLEQAQYRIPAHRIRGSAAVAELLNNNEARFEDISYTTCAPGNEAWILKASELEIDRSTGVGTAHHAILKFAGVPFVYLPYATFPIDNRRKSGFLTPSVGHSSESGFDVTVPYYFNIAPDMDATFTPRYLGKRGWMLGGELRYLSDWYAGQINAEIMPNDDTRNNGDNSVRGAFSYRGKSIPISRWQLDTDINYASDKEYLGDVSDSLSSSSSRHLERRGDLRYVGDDWEFLGRLQYFQTVDRTIAASDRPYARLPQLLLDLNKEAFGLGFHLNSEYVYFDREDSVRGQRFDVQPGISIPLRNSWGFFIPKVSARYTTYSLEDQGAAMPEEPDRTVYSGSLDTGLLFERNGDGIVQTLEPRLFYLYTTRENQDDLPVFDTSEYDFSFANLFRENRFNGSDRVGDANQLAVALTSRTLDDASGTELFRASIGQIFYFADREVQLPGMTVNEDSSSAIVGEVAARLGEHWNARGTLLWDPQRGHDQTQRGAAHLQYRGDGGGILNLGYRYQAGLLEQGDISFRIPITRQLHAVARWDYSFRDDRTLESFGGVEYESCCWAVRVVARHYVNDENNNENTAFFLQLELKGLTSLGHRLDQFLEEGILGYQRNTYY